MIEAERLSKRYEGGALALNALDLAVSPGEIYCLLGANGAGKTTTINLFLGFLQPTSGTARICGIEVHREPLKAKQHVGFVSENVRLYPNLTARQNLHFFAELSGKAKANNEAYYAVLDSAGLPKRAFDQRVREFSKGMRQKVGIAIAMIKEAEALFLDEPMSGLDPKAAADLVKILRRLREEKKAILMSTHDIFRAKELADHVGIMKEGNKVSERSRSELAHENLEQIYLDFMREESTS
ncbi:MAG: type transport system ATP-binding protein [Acidobacteriota bacterium]|jgi:ABC-2 type transport system ATP-binding protein|nr:type transport system ATP-binding protein [Acidobacteriota bacterium]